MSPTVYDGLVASAEVTVVLATGWAAATALRGSSAATRHQVWAVAVVAALVVPWVGLVVPAGSLELADVAPVGAQVVRDGLPLGAGLAQTRPLLPVVSHAAWPDWLAAGWAVGAALVALRFARAWLLAWGLGRRAAPSDNVRWLAARRLAAGHLGLRGDVPLARSAETGTPLTIGLLRPRVLLPASADDWSPERLNAVLLHELGHVRRRDLAAQGAAQLLCALCWYNPLAWLAAARLRVERELAADDLVLTAGVRPSSYAADLVAIARGLVPAGLTHGAASMAESPTTARVMRILDPAAPRASVRGPARAAMWGLALLAVVGTAAAAPGNATKAGAKTRSANTPTVTLVKSRYTVIENTVPYAPVAIDPTFLPAVEAALNANLGELQRCYERRLDARPGLAGNMAMEWAISAAGTFEDGCLESDEIHDSDLGDCVRDLTIHTRYPALSDPQGLSRPVTVSFHFAPG